MQHYRTATIFIISAVLILGLVAFVQFGSGEAATKRLVTDFGSKLKNVPLSGTADVAREAMRENYAEFVTSSLLEQWLSDPESAPGRLTSSPWPERIEITSVAEQGSGYVVHGNVILMTSEEVTQGGIAGLVPVVIQVIETDDGWQIAVYQEQQTS